MSVLVQISFHFQALHILILFFLFLGTLCLCLKSQSLFGLINLILCMSTDILPRSYIHTLLPSYGWLTSVRNDPLRSICVDTCGYVTSGSVSGRGFWRLWMCDPRYRVWGWGHHWQCPHVTSGAESGGLTPLHESGSCVPGDPLSLLFL